MRWILLTLFFLSTIIVKSQSQDSIICFPKKDILTLANKIQLLKDSIKWKNDIIYNQDTLLIDRKKRLLLCEYQLDNRQNSMNNLEQENKLLRESVDLLKPKWYDNKWFWFGNGILVTVATVILLR